MDLDKDGLLSQAIISQRIHMSKLADIAEGNKPRSATQQLYRLRI